MPVLSENLKNYFEVLNKYANESNSQELGKKDDIKDTDINSLFNEVYVEEALEYVKKEFLSIKLSNKELLVKLFKRHSKTLELMMVIYQLHGKFEEELNAIKLNRRLWEYTKDWNEIYYCYAMEALWHMVHDNKSCIPEKSVKLCQKISDIRSSEMTKKSFLISLVKLICASSNPDYPVLFKEIKILKNHYHSFFEKCTLESFTTRNLISYYEHILKTKALNMGLIDGNFNFIENGLVMRKVSVKSIDYLRSRHADLKIFSGSYDTLVYLWTFINQLLIGMDFVSECFTLMGIEKEARQYQYEYFVYSVKYCVPFRTKMAVRMLMHNEFIYIRLPELEIRHCQLDQLKGKSNRLKNSILSNANVSNMNPELAEFHYGMTSHENDLLNSSFAKLSKSKKQTKPHILNISQHDNTEVTFENCFLFKSTFKADFLQAFDVVKSYIWQIDNTSLLYSFNNDWEDNFIEPEENDENDLLNDVTSLSLSTPKNSPTKPLTPENRPILNRMNAPLRANRYTQRATQPILMKKEKDKLIGNDEDDSIESYNTLYVPIKARNIRYENPELPRSNMLAYKKAFIHEIIDKWSHDDEDCNRWTLFDRFDRLSLQDVKNDNNTGPSLISYLEKHVSKYKYLNVPILHRPIYQRLGLHYLSTDKEKAAFFFSLAINIGFRQLYTMESLMKTCNTNHEFSMRWKKTQELVSKSMENENYAKGILCDLMPKNWTILQFNMIDEMPIGCIKSSLLDNIYGGCFGARNVAVLLVTKYQRLEIDGKSQLVIETRVLHGFRKTGLQLIDQLENLKNESAKALQISDRKVWWSTRYGLDTKMQNLTNQMRSDWFGDSNLKWMMDEGMNLECEPKILIADRNISKLPLECLLNRDESRPKCITRMPNVPCLIAHLYQIRYRRVEYASKKLYRTNLEVNPYNAFYLVNPDNTLQETEDAVMPLFKKMNWDGMTGKTVKSLNAKSILDTKDILIYCGHGTGSRYFMERSMKSITSTTSMFLIGCQSARFIVEGRSEAFGLLMNYLTNGCPSIFGLLWDVTDREIDKFTLKMFSNWLTKQNHNEENINSETYSPSAPMPSYVFNSETISNVQLKTLTGKSAIIIGLPTWIDKNIQVPEIAI